MTDALSTIDIHRHFDAPREAVYRAFTDEAEVAAWFAPLGGQVLPETVSIDATVGGHRRLTMVTYSGALSWSVDTTFTEVIENERLVGHEDVTGYPEFEDADRLTLSVDFFDEGSGTRIELSEGPCTPEMEAVGREFWLQSFTKLDALLAADS
jgi:uncharacterized protein YndB with AHSA1/START domain